MWRELDRDATPDPALHEVLKLAERDFGGAVGKPIADPAPGVFTGGTVAPVGGEGSPRQVLEIRKRFPPDTNNLGWPPLVRALMEKIRRPVSAIDRIYFTQLNARTIEYVMADLGLPLSKTHMIMDKWGYTGSACMPMALDDAVEGSIGPQPGELVIFCGSGAGYTMAAAAFVWTG